VLFTRSLTKLSLHFLDFSRIFYAFSKFQKIDFTIGDSLSQRGPWNFSKPHKHAPSSQESPWKDIEPCNVALGGGGGAAPANSGEAGGAPGRVGVQGGVHAHLGLVCAQGWGGGTTGGGERR
jgi:hypothetical protein